jgi:hypothetical protein
MKETIWNKIATFNRNRILWFNSTMLTLLPTVELMKDNLPDLATYLQPGIYKWVGLAVVISNILLHIKKPSNDNSKPTT